MSQYPATPDGWNVVSRRTVGPFTTGVSYRRPDGRRIDWASRGHRKHASRLSRLRPGDESVWWAPHRASWWISVLFMVGSSCFVVAPLPVFAEATGPRADGAVFFVGSVFFTSAATLQWLETINADRGPGSRAAHPDRLRTRWVVWEPRRIDWWVSGVQLLGTLFFNITTFRGLTKTVEGATYDQVVWRPDALGSICFLVSGYLAYAEVAGGIASRPPRTLEGAVVSVNLLGCLAFGVSAVTGFVVPATDASISLAITNVSTCGGAVCFLVGAVLLLPEAAKVAR